MENNNAPETTETETATPETSEPKSRTRRVYLRGPKDSKRVLVLSAGTLYEAEFTVKGFDDISGDTCEVAHDEAAGTIQVTWADGTVNECGVAPTFASDDPRLDIDVDTIAAMPALTITASVELRSHVPEKGEAPTLGKVLKHLAIDTRRTLADAFAALDADGCTDGTEVVEEAPATGTHG